MPLLHVKMCIKRWRMSSQKASETLYAGSHSRKDIMNKFVALIIAAGAITSASAGTNVGVSIDINQPGVYGRINIGNVAPPTVVYAQPMIIAPAPVAVQMEPIYLYVPPAHQKNWAKHCKHYNACGQPVYFVQEKWVRERYQQQQREHQGERDHREHDRGERDKGERGHGEHDRRD
jgi:hypothetical protein